MITRFLILLGPSDAYNSRDVLLDDVCAITQQDRATGHHIFIHEGAD